jgi:predicted phage tail protein
MNAPILAGKKNLFSSLSSSSSPDNLFSDDIVELLLGVSEGPIQGLVNGPQSIYLNDTPLVNNVGTPELGNQQGVNVNNLGTTNFGQFDVELHLGYDPPDTIQSKLGGFGNTNSVGVLLDTNLPIVRTGTLQNIDYLSFRVLFQALYSVNTSTGAQGRTTGSFKIEYKANSASSWNQTYTTINPAPGAVASTSTSTMQAYTAAGTGGSQSANNYRETWLQPTPPTSQTPDAVWFNTTNLYSPAILVGGVWTVPTGLQYFTPAGSYPYYQWVENGVTIHAYITPTGSTPPPGFSTSDLWVVESDPSNNGQPQSYIYNTTGWVTNIGWILPGNSTPGIVNITGQTSGGYVAEFRIPVARIADFYDVRVTKLSPENTPSFVCNMVFDSFLELVNNPISFEGLSVLYAAVRASDQFASMPTLTLDLYGMLVNVPSNYNPITKVYTGVWDGTWTKAYSDNPAYIAQDLILNDRYGLNTYYPATVDPDSVYAFGQHCDTHGFTYNELIANERPIAEAVNVILGTAGGFYAEFGDGNGIILFDDDTDAPVALFTIENISDGIFTYSRTDITARKNDFIVSYIDPNQNWIENRRRVTDAASVAAYGLNTDEFVAAGCIDETEAYKRARLRLIVSTTECTIVDFKTNRQGLYVQPYDVILVADALAGYGLSGRINSVVSANSVLLRDAVTLESGFTYQLSFQIPDGSGSYTIWESQITTGAGTTTLLTTQAALPTLPDFAAFSVTSSGSEGTPKAFRITSIDETDGDPDRISISAIEINRSKWAYVDGTIALPTTVVTGSNTGNSVAPPSNLSVTAQINTPGQQDLLISWTPSVSALVRQTNIYYSFNGGATSELASVSNGQTNYLYKNVAAGKYLFALTAQNVNGFESVTAEIDFTVGGTVRTVQGPTNLAIQNEPVAGTFNSQSPTFTWTASQDPFLYGYTIQVLNATTGAVVRSTTLLPSATSWTYTYAENTSDGAGTPSRSFTISLISNDNQGNSSLPLTLACNNPLPSAPIDVTATPINFEVGITFIPPTVKDYAGTRIYASATNPVAIIAGNLVYDGPNTLINQPLASGATMYYALGCYDNFDTTLGPTVTVEATGQSAFVTLLQIDSTINKLLNVTPPTLVSTLSADSMASSDWAETQTAAVLADALAQRRVALQQVATVGTVAAIAQQNVSAQALQTSNLTQQLSNQIGANLAAYSNFVSTQLAINAATTTSINSLTATVTGNYDTLSGEITTTNAAITANQSAQATTNTSLSNQITALTATVTGNYNTLSGEITTNAAAITANQSAQATINAATTTSINSLTATVTGNYDTLSGEITSLSLSTTTGNSNLSTKSDLVASAYSNSSDLSEINSVLGEWQAGNVARQATLSNQSALAGIANVQTALTSATLAQTSIQMLLSAQIGANLATYESFAASQATTNTALSTLITSLTATVTGNYDTLSGEITTTNAAIAANQSAQATTNTATAASISSLNTSVANNSSLITSLSTTLSTTTGTSAIKSDTVAAGASAIADAAEVEAFLNAIQSQESSTQLTKLAAQGIAAATTQTNAQADAASALASVQTVLGAAIGDTNASLTNEALVRSNADTALSQQITTLTADLGATNATISNNQAAQSTTNASVAASINTLTSNYGTLSANVSNYQTTQATQNSTFASQITNIQATSNAGTANGSMQFSTTSSSISGVTAAYALRVSASQDGNNIQDAGLYVQVGSGFSYVSITAGSFYIQAGPTHNHVFSANADGTLTLNAVTNVSSVLKSSGLGGNGQPYMTQNFGSSPSIIIDDGT